LTSPLRALRPPSSSTPLKSTSTPMALLLASLKPSKAALAPPLSIDSLAILTPSFQSFARPET
jgi:hypothetical protein